MCSVGIEDFNFRLVKDAVRSCEVAPKLAGALPISNLRGLSQASLLPQKVRPKIRSAIQTMAIRITSAEP